jgi:tetratricopeptide (TPR) repeat protein
VVPAANVLTTPLVLVCAIVAVVLGLIVVFKDDEASVRELFGTTLLTVVVLPIAIVFLAAWWAFARRKRSSGAAATAAGAGATPLESQPPRPPAIALPDLQPSESWPAKPGVTLRLGLVDDPPPEPENPTEEIYDAGLEALSNHDAPAALQHFRSVIAEDRVGAYSTARLLALVLSAEVGDVATLRVLLGSCITNAQPDDFAQRAIKESLVDFYWTQASDRPDIVVWECIDQPAVTAQIALAGCLLAVGQTAEAVKALEGGVTVWEARHTAWRNRAGQMLEKTRWGYSEWMEERLVHADPGDWGFREDVRKQIDAVLPDRTAPRRRAGPLVGFDATICRLYMELEDVDAVLRYIDRYPPWAGSELTRALALEAKGLRDAALVVIDDYLRKPPESEAWATLARYQKADLLLEQGDRQRARKELARIYADNPNFDDWRGLRAELDRPTERQSRTAIPEDVRHAVWRRDEGRCVQCGSQEKLEFDHIIPLSHGGANTERNLQLLCEPCNRRKGAAV